jgi:hypothetical protein
MDTLYVAYSLLGHVFSLTMAFDSTIFEHIQLHDPVLVSHFLEARIRYKRIIDNKNPGVPAHKKINNSWKSVIATRTLVVTCKYNLKVSVEDVTKEELKTCLKGNDLNLFFLA